MLALASLLAAVCAFVILSVSTNSQVIFRQCWRQSTLCSAPTFTQISIRNKFVWVSRDHWLVLYNFVLTCLLAVSFICIRNVHKTFYLHYFSETHRKGWRRKLKHFISPEKVFLASLVCISIFYCNSVCVTELWLCCMYISIFAIVYHATQFSVCIFNMEFWSIYT